MASTHRRHILAPVRSSPTRPGARPAAHCVAAVVCGLIACASPGCRIPKGFDSPESMARVDAALEATDRGDMDSLPHLIEMLDSDDPFVRLVGIRTLERLTGETKGYRHDDPPADRRRAADAWAEWWLAQPNAQAQAGVAARTRIAGLGTPGYPWADPDA